MIQRITLNEDLTEIMARLSAHTGLSITAITNRLLGSHLPEMHELDAFLEANSAGAGSLHEQGLNLIHSYGPESIMAGIARIAPRWETLSARFDRDLDKSVSPLPTLPQ